MKESVPVERRIQHPIGLAVHSILWRDWDPIGVHDWGPDDEYDGYVWPIIGKIMRGESVEQIAAYLDWATNEHMECPLEPGRNPEISRQLAALKPEA